MVNIAVAGTAAEDIVVVDTAVAGTAAEGIVEAGIVVDIAGVDIVVDIAGVDIVGLVVVVAVQVGRVAL